MENKSLKRIALALVMVLPLLAPVRSQESAFVANRQKMALLPGDVRNMSIVDGELYCSASGLLLKAQRSGEQVLGFWADTDFVRYEEGIEYVVRHPKTGDYYVVVRDKNERPYLYVATKSDKGLDLKQVRMGGSSLFNKGMTVEHPTFTPDGRIMIFASADRYRSQGGYDLWYSQHDGKRWSKPVNLGPRVNTNSDEVAPTVYYDCLLFSSNGHKEDEGSLNLYATRLVSDRVEGDTIGMLQIGRCRVQMLPAPLNAENFDDFDMAIDTLSGCGYWVSLRDAKDGESQLFSFSGALDGVLLWGMVSDAHGQTMEGVKVTARQGDDVVCNTYTDADGFYRMYLQCDQYYDLSFQLDNYFVSFETVNTAKEDGAFLISEARQDVQLDHLPMGERLYYEDLFGPNVDTELSERGMETLAPLVRFLNDNPSASLQMSLSNDLTTDRKFNSLLTDQRIQTLQSYLLRVLPPTVKMTIANGCAGYNGCANASGQSRLMVIMEVEN